MAKKKASHANTDKPLRKPLAENVRPNQQVAAVKDSEASEKLENLKSLNQMLLKEAFERRQQVECLIQFKVSLELELTRSNSEKEALRHALTDLSENAFRSELERSVASVFIASQIGQKIEVMEVLEREVRKLKEVLVEKECQIGVLNRKTTEIECVLGNEREVSMRIWSERDELKDRLDSHVAESKRSTENLIEMEERKREMERQIIKLQVAFDGVVVEKEEMEKTIESAVRDKDLLERGIVELNRIIDRTKEELCGIVREKEVFEAGKNIEMLKRCELEGVASKLRETLVNLQQEEQKLRVNVVELKNKCVEGEEKQKLMRREIDGLVAETKCSETRVEELTDEKNVLQKNFLEAVNQLDNKRQNIEGLVNEKIGLLEANGRLDCEVGSLHKQMAEIKAMILELEESHGVRDAKVKSLESEVGAYVCKLKDVKTNRDEIRNCLEEERKSSIKLKEQIENMDKKIEESLKVAGETMARNGAILVEKINLEGRCESLKKKVASLENALVEARNEFSSMKGKFESADANSKLALEMLKGTAVFCAEDDDTGLGDLRINHAISGEEEREFVLLFDMIKSAFKRKVMETDAREIQLEFLQNSVKEADMKKSFWTVLSCVTTLLAAVSLAYVARGH